MRDVTAELKALRLHGMAGAWTDLVAQGGGVGVDGSRWLIEQVNRNEQQSAVFYFHPWEIDPGQPRIAGIDAKTRFRHYVNIGRTEARIAQLLRDFAWGRMDQIFLGRVQGERQAAAAAA